MAAINELISQIQDVNLRDRILQEVSKLQKQKKFGLVYEEHIPEATPLYDVPIRKGTKVVLRDGNINECYRVQDIMGENASCIRLDDSKEQVTLNVRDLVPIAHFGEPIYPYLKYVDSVSNAPDSDLWHTLIQADNYHALQLLVYLYGGKVDCIYIDPPYNTGAKDWKYNNDYVDSNDSYRHSKWLSMMEKRLKLAKKLLNPQKSVLIVTIDEKEYLHLGCLIEQMFPEADITMISSLINPAGTGAKENFGRTNEFIFFVMFGDCVVTPQEVIDVEGEEVSWDSLRRHNPANLRPTRPSQFYPIYIDKSSTRIVKVGEPITPDVDRFSVPNIPGCETVFPVKDDGTEMMWGILPSECRRRLEKGYVKVGKYSPEKPQQFSLQFLTSGTIDAIERGDVRIVGHRKDGSVIAEYYTKKKILPKTQWSKESHDATRYGTNLLNEIIGKRFNYPKSLYAVADCLRYFVAHNPEALILDFFAGSGTTMHAVNLLNTEDGGHRRCIMVTNNEVSVEEAMRLTSMGYKPGDDEWEKWGIARYVNWPRTECSIRGIDVKGNPICGEYTTSLTEIKQVNRRFVQINYLTENPTLKQKKALISLINKQKTVKLPSLSEDVDFLVADDNDSCNASILFNADMFDDWKEAVEGHDTITDFYIVTKDDALFRKIKAEVNEVMGPIEESVPVLRPMSEGFKANAIYFKLGFLDKTSVSLGQQLRELISVLWMKAGAKGVCPSIEKADSIPPMMILPENEFAILNDEKAFSEFIQQIEDHESIKMVYLVVNSDAMYREMTKVLSSGTFASRNIQTCQLYRDYLDNFRINTPR